MVKGYECAIQEDKTKQVDEHRKKCSTSSLIRTLNINDTLDILTYLSVGRQKKRSDNIKCYLRYR